MFRKLASDQKASESVKATFKMTHDGAALLRYTLTELCAFVLISCVFVNFGMYNVDEIVSRDAENIYISFVDFNFDHKLCTETNFGS